MTLQEALKYTTDGRTHLDFTQAAEEDPQSYTKPLAYADWLDDQGWGGLASHLRKSVEQKQAAADGVKTTLYTGLSHPLNEGVQYDGIVANAFPLKSGVVVSTAHPSEKSYVVYRATYSPEEAKEALISLEKSGVDITAGVRNMQRKFPHLFPSTEEQQ